MVTTVVPIVDDSGTYGEDFLPRGRTILDLRCDGLHYAVTQDLDWPPAILRDGDFSGRMPHTELTLLQPVTLQKQ